MKIKFDLNNPRTLATTGIMTALVMGMTLIQIATTPDGGYIHLGEIAMYFASFAFGPWVGAVAGGLGAGLADVVSGYPQWAPLTLVVHGLKCFIVGWIAYGDKTPLRLGLAVLVGGLIMVTGFFLGSGLIPFLGGWSLAVPSLLPNAVQAATGLLGAAVFFAVAQAYPRIQQTGQS